MPMAYAGLQRISNVPNAVMRGGPGMTADRNALAHDGPQMTSGADPGHS